MSQGSLMNSKSEWNNSGIPRIVIETGEKLEEDQESGLGRKNDTGRANPKFERKEGQHPQIIDRREKRQYEGIEVEEISL